MRFQVSIELLVVHGHSCVFFCNPAATCNLKSCCRKAFHTPCFVNRVIFLLREAREPLTFSPFDISPDLPVKVYITLVLFKVLVFN